MKQYLLAVSVLAFSLGLGNVAQAQSARDGLLQPPVTPASELKYVPLDPKDTQHVGVMVHVIFGSMDKKGPVAYLARLPAGFSAGMHAHRSDLYITTIKGDYFEWRQGEPEGKAGGVGGTVFMPANVPHNNRCDAKGGPCLNYAYAPDGFNKQ